MDLHDAIARTRQVAKDRRAAGAMLAADAVEMVLDELTRQGAERDEAQRDLAGIRGYTRDLERELGTARTVVVESVLAATDGAPNVHCPRHGYRLIGLNGPEEMCEDCRVLAPDGRPLGWNDGRPTVSEA